MGVTIGPKGPAKSAATSETMYRSLAASHRAIKEAASKGDHDRARSIASSARELVSVMPKRHQERAGRALDEAAGQYAHSAVPGSEG